MLKQGFAKANFARSHDHIPWHSSHIEEKEHQWPMLDKLFIQKKISYLDYFLPHRLLRNHREVREGVALFLCHLSLAAKEGHLCIQVTEKSLSPSVVDLWKNEEGLPLSSDESDELTEMILMGSKFVPEAIIATSLSFKENSAVPLCREGNLFYLQRHWMFETVFLNHLKRHTEILPALSLNHEKIKQTLDQLYREKILLKEQAQAIEQACLNPLTLITGGPGTGKTYTAGYLIRVFWENLTLEQRKTCQVVIAAPTGKAASNLQRSLGRVASSLDGFPLIQSKTLHSLLGLKQSVSYQEPERLSADLVVVDESSMIDIRMMAALFESLKPGSRLILLGDKYQLPSVEAGSVFVDLIHLHHDASYLIQEECSSIASKINISSVSLTTCLRAELNSLIDFAQLVNQGKKQEVLNVLETSEKEGIKRGRLSHDKKSAQRQFLSHVIAHFPLLTKPEMNLEQLLNLFQSIRLLSPLRKGPFGVESLNQLIWEKLIQNTPKTGWIAIPIMITVNDYRQELFNGETGVLIRRLPVEMGSSEDYALFAPRQEGDQVRRLSALQLPQFELAYCLSVHKSQGSEFDRVILVLPDGSEMFGREVFYTAITRARKSLEVYGSDQVILKTVERQGIRLSGIQSRVRQQF